MYGESPHGLSSAQQVSAQILGVRRVFDRVLNVRRVIARVVIARRDFA